MPTGVIPGKVTRLGVVAYLNARPLIYRFQVRPEPGIELVDDVPSRLTEQLLAGQIDAGIISSIECFRSPHLEHLTTVGLACSGAVLSVKLFSQRPLDRVRSVALDTSSRTAAALTRILFAERFGACPEFCQSPPDLDRMLDRCDAALLIGDPALRTHTEITLYDLGAEWLALTGLPFVYALWAGQPGVFGAGLGALLEEAEAFGAAHIDAISEREAPLRGFSRSLCYTYLTDIIRFRLTAEDREGLARFVELARKHGLC